MSRRLLAMLAAAAIAGTVAIWAPWSATAAPPTRVSYEPHLDPKDFSLVIDNPYYPLPVGRTWVYKGIRDGQTQTDTVRVTSRTKVVAEGITARVVSDVATHGSTLLERTADYFAQDKQGNVWYLGENTTAYLPNGHKDHSGSWEAGVHDAEPGIIMLADPEIPDSYRQEYLKGQAEDTAWIINRGGSITVPFGTVHRVLTSLEFARIEPHVVDRKIYGPGIGIVSETALTGPQEIAVLVSMTG
jgi:hypothetical protein